MMFARWTFLLAGIYGLLILGAGLLAEIPVGGRAQMLLEEPEFYYGFLGSALVWQLVFLLVSSDPVRWRSLMPICVLEKLAFLGSSAALVGAGRMPIGAPFVGAIIDGLLAVLFLLAWRRTPGPNAAPAR